MTRSIHPEAESGEVWIGNMFASDFRSIGWNTKRLGKIAYFANGKPIPKNQGCRPVFVQRVEIEAANVAIPDSGVIDHRWIVERDRIMQWEISHRAELRSRLIADRHYNRQKPGSPQFVPPGRCLVLYAGAPPNEAFWVTSYPFAEYVKHQWGGAWICSAFRNENAGIASELILDALAASRAYFGEPPPLGLVTFLDTKKVKPTKIRGKDTWGYTWLKAGFKHVGFTKSGLMAFQILPKDMPPAKAALSKIPVDLISEPDIPNISNHSPTGSVSLMPITLTITIDQTTTPQQMRSIQELLGFAINATAPNTNGTQPAATPAAKSPDKAQAPVSLLDSLPAPGMPAQPFIPAPGMPAQVIPAALAVGPVQPAQVAEKPTGKRGRPAMTPEQKAARAAEKANASVKDATPVSQPQTVPVTQPQAAAMPAAPAQAAQTISLPGMPATNSAPGVDPLYAEAQAMYDRLNGILPNVPFNILRSILPNQMIFKVTELPREHLPTLMEALHRSLPPQAAA